MDLRLAYNEIAGEENKNVSHTYYFVTQHPQAGLEVMLQHNGQE